MQTIRSILAILSGPIVYGVLYLLGNHLTRMLTPASFNADGSTSILTIQIIMLLSCLLYAIVAGYISAWIAKRYLLAHTIVLAIVLLAIGIAVQIPLWHTMPPWFHYSLLMTLVAGIAAGGYIRNRLKPVEYPIGWPIPQ